ncbi:MAG: nuclear transport factor 2 family protein [Rhizomicrobium sp.]
MSDALDVVQRFYTLLGSGDAAAALALLDADIEWTEAPNTPYYAGTMRGVDAVVAGLFQPLGRDFADFATTPHDFVSEGDRVVSFGTYAGTARQSGRKMSAPFVHVWTVVDGRLKRFQQYTDSAAWNSVFARG